MDAAGTVVVGAGATLASVQRHARAAGWAFGLDFAARDSATVGGAVATNAGGLRVLRWGPARAQVVGVEAVLASGAVLSRVGGPVKDSTGYDLSGLLCGSEGTLGVLTRVRLRLVPPLPAERAVALVGVDTVAAAGTVLAAVRRRLPGLAAAELIGASALALAVRQGVPAPLLRRLAGVRTAGDRGSRRGGRPGRGAGGGTGRGRRRAGGGRGGPGSAVALPGGADTGDLRRRRAAEARRLDAARGAGDGVGGAARDRARGCRDDPLRTPGRGEPARQRAVRAGGGRAGAVTEEVLRLVADAGGSISAEHGIGRAKARWLGLTRSPAEVAAMRAVKTALDPAGLLNPGVLLADLDQGAGGRPGAASVRGGGS